MASSAASAGAAAAGAVGPGEHISEEDRLSTGPFSLLYAAVRSGDQVLINCRNNHRLLARVKAFDRHCNMVLENVKEMWQEAPRSGKKKAEPVNRQRYVGKMFLRGDGVVVVLANPAVVESS